MIIRNYFFRRAIKGMVKSGMEITAFETHSRVKHLLELSPEEQALLRASDIDSGSLFDPSVEHTPETTGAGFMAELAQKVTSSRLLRQATRLREELQEVEGQLLDEQGHLQDLEEERETGLRNGVLIHPDTEIPEVLQNTTPLMEKPRTFPWMGPLLEGFLGLLLFLGETANVLPGIMLSLGIDTLAWEYAWKHQKFTLISGLLIVIVIVGSLLTASWLVHLCGKYVWDHGWGKGARARSASILLLGIALLSSLAFISYRVSVLRVDVMAGAASAAAKEFGGEDASVPADGSTHSHVLTFAFLSFLAPLLLVAVHCRGQYRRPGELSPVCHPQPDWEHDRYHRLETLETAKTALAQGQMAYARQQRLITETERSIERLTTRKTTLENRLDALSLSGDGAEQTLADRQAKRHQLQTQLDHAVEHDRTLFIREAYRQGKIHLVDPHHPSLTSAHLPDHTDEYLHQLIARGTTAPDTQPHEGGHP